jgi:inositol phosphorylceramide mannosyltransferase catalytic subunit
LDAKIPQILHFIWIGSKPQPKSFSEYYLKQWRDAHPEFEVKVWGEKEAEKEADSFQLKSIILDKTLNPGLRADALRYEILFKYGGIYVDTDMALVKPIRTLLEDFTTDFFIGVSYSSAFEVNNAIVGAIPGHHFFKTSIEKLKATFD